MNLRITSVRFDADRKLLDYIDKKVRKLSHFYDRIVDADVFLKLENSGQVKGKIVELKVNVPGDTLLATEDGATFEAATDLIVDNMKRQIIKHKERMRPTKGSAGR